MLRWATRYLFKVLSDSPPLAPPHLFTNLSKQFQRESARERGLEADTRSALPPHPPQDHRPRPPSMLIPAGQRLSPQPTPHRGDLPVHPRQVSRAMEACQAVFKALARLLPLRSGGGGRLGAGGNIGRMQAAAVRCGQKCQGYIRALQRGIEVCYPSEGKPIVLDLSHRCVVCQAVDTEVRWNGRRNQKAEADFYFKCGGG